MNKIVLFGVALFLAAVGIAHAVGWQSPTS